MSQGFGFTVPATFLWGDSLNNVLRFGYAPDSAIAYSRPRAGSR